MSAPYRSQRYLAVDVLRGATVVLMIVVNMAISREYSFNTLLHSTWNGFTLADAVFPTFLFVVGNAMALAFDRAPSQQPGWDRILRRSLLLVAVGMFVSNFPFGRFDAGNHWIWTDYANIRIPGVLQRIGLAYLIAAALIRFAGVRGVWVYALLAVPLNHWLMLHFGDLTLEGSAALKLDTAVFGSSHLYQGEGRPYDPEGLLGTIPAAVNMLAGYLAIRTIRAASATLADMPSRPGLRSAVVRLAMVGALVAVLGLASQSFVPLNKKLWSSSFTVFTIGLDLLLIALLVWLVDIRKLRLGTEFFAVFGRNPLALYIISEMLMSLTWTIPLGKKPAFMAIFDSVFLGQETGKWGSLAFALALVLLVWAIGRQMDRKGIHLRL